MGGHVFLSYAHEDEAYAVRLARHLADLGLAVWFDQAIATGDPWAVVLERQIEECAAVVVVMSEAARESSWVRREVMLAADLGKPLVPLLRSGRMPLPLYDLQYYDVLDGRLPEDGFLDLLRGMGVRPVAVPLPTPAGRAAAWAWWSKPPGSPQDYAILDAEHGSREEIGEEIRALTPGTPNLHNLPWAVFASTTDPHPLHRVCWWDWTTGHDAAGRPILGVLYLRLSGEGPVSYQELARRARQMWRERARTAGAPAPPPEFVEPAQMRWAAHVAALMLSRPVRIVREGDPEQLAVLFDAVTTFLPAPVRAVLKLATHSTRRENGPFALTGGRAGGDEVISVRPGELPDLSPLPESLAYRDVLDRLLREHPVEEIARHLSTAATMPARLGREAARAATGHLATLDRVVAVGADLVEGRAVDPREVRALAAGNELAERLPLEQHLAFLRSLLAGGEPADLSLIAANWTPQAIEPFGAALARHWAVPEWTDAAVDVIRTAGGDRIMLVLLDELRGHPGSVQILLRAVTAGVDLPQTRRLLVGERGEELLTAALEADAKLLAPWLQRAADLTAAERAAADFALIVALQVPLPSLAAGSRLALDGDYARRLAALHDRHPQFRLVFHVGLWDTLKPPDATTDALHLLDRMRRAAGTDDRFLLSVAAGVALARPGLFEEHVSAEFRDLLLAFNVKLRHATAVRAVTKAIGAGAPVADLAGALADAHRAGVRPDGGELTGWPAAGDAARMAELAAEVGARLTDGGREERFLVGLRTLIPWLDPAGRNRLRAWAGKRMADIGVDLARLREQAAQLAAVRDVLGGTREGGGHGIDAGR